MSSTPPTEEPSAAASATAGTPSDSLEKLSRPEEQAPKCELPTIDSNSKELVPAPGSNSKELVTPSPTTPQPPEVSYSPPVATITIPSYSRWFSFEEIHETERRFLTEFFADSKSASKNPRVYKYYRDVIIRRYRENPSRKITFTEVRRMLVGDVGSIRRVFDFLEGWGLINYTGAAGKSNLKGEEKENKSMGVNGLSSTLSDTPLAKKESAKKVCGGCKAVCSLACFSCEKVDLILCSRCFVRGNYQIGLNSSDFKRVDIGEAKTDWTDKETLHLIEAVLQYGDDWKKVAEHVGGRSDKECVTRFIRLPFGEQFMGPPDIDEIDEYYQMKDQINGEIGEESSTVASLAKRRRLSPLADASNPIMAQAAFLSAMVGSEVAEAAANAAVAALSKGGFSNVHSENCEQIGSLSKENDQQQAINANGHTSAGALKKAVAQANDLLEKEEQSVEQSISNIIEVQMKEIQEKIVCFEDMEMQMEKEWLQLNYMKSLLFADQLTVLQHKAPLKFTESVEEKNTTDAVS